MNKGFTPDKIAEQIILPKKLANSPFLKEFYGTPEWSAKNVFTGYLGWFDGNPSSLKPLKKSTEEIYNFVKIDAKYDEEKRKKFSSSTASKTQIKKDIYTSSVSRSKVYDSYLEEFEKSYTNQSQYWDKYLRDQKII